jgi:hypothetical protein
MAGAGGPMVIVPLFVLYDYSFRPDGTTTKDEALALAYETGIVCSDEAVLYPFDAGPEAFAIFGAVQQVAAFVGSNRESWIGDALRPPVEHDPEPDQNDVAEAAA